MDDMTTKDALFALDTTMDEDMKSYREEATTLAIKSINKDVEVYGIAKSLKSAKELGDYIAQLAERGKDHEFGGLHYAEMPIVDWHKVYRTI